MTRRVVITGLGVISPIGNDKKKFWQSLKLGKSAIGPLDASIPPTNISIGARIAGFDPKIHFAPQDLALLDPVSQFATVAAREAALDARLNGGDLKLSSAAAIIGTGCGGKHTDEETYVSLYQQGRSRVHPLTIPKGMPSAAASAVSRDLGIKGPVFSVASACASGAHAIIQGYLFLKSGLADIAVVGGADAPFTYGLLKAWDALRVVSKDTCRPFSKDRS
jgi:nodulation protein E